MLEGKSLLTLFPKGDIEGNRALLVVCYIRGRQRLYNIQ
jgi:hypothetical protein